MTQSSNRYWLFGLVLAMLGAWQSFSSKTQLFPRPEATARASHTLTASAGLDAASGTSSPAASAEQAGQGGAPDVDSTLAAKPDPCARWQELLADYVALYRSGSHGEAESPTRDDYLLALVPDPDLTGQRNAFASVLDGLEEAVADGDFVRDRSWLPWSDSTPPCAERAPGMILFRPRSPRDEPPLVVLIVGETPTWGVRKKQLEAALGRVPSGPQPLKVLGPTFSGTAASLIAIIEQRHEHLQLVSGTATSPDLNQLFRPPSFSFRATVPNETQLLAEMLQYLRRRGGSANRIALLSEAATTYGSNVSHAKELKATPASKADPLIELRFPVDLHPLRDAVSAALPLPAAGEPESPKAEDAQVLVLDAVARALSEQRVRFVGVIATDPADVVLLTSRLRSKLPDARFFTIGGDIEFADPHEAEALNGMLVVHAAPPPTLDRDTYNGTRAPSISLKSELVRNVYLAGRALLGAPLSPPVPRVSLVGNGALWEIGDQKPSFPPPHSYWTVTVITFIDFAAILLVVIWPWLARKAPSFGEFTLARHRGPLSLAFAACERRDLSADDAFVSAALLSVVAGGALLMLIALYAHQHTLWCCVGVVGTLAACWSRVIIRGSRGELEPAQPSAFLCSLLATVATVLALGIGCGGRHEATLNLLSGGSGVVAGLIGFGMLAVGLWCWRVRLRFLDTHRFGSCPRSSEPPLATAFAETERSGKGLFALERQLLAVIHSPWSALPLVPIGVHLGLLFSVWLIYSVRTPAAFEPGWRNALVVGFGLLSLLPVTVNFSRIVATWIVLKRLLECLALYPILEPLRHLPRGLSRNLEQQLTIPNADLNELGPLIELLTKASVPYPLLAAKVESARTSWEAALREQASRQFEPNGKSAGEVMTLLLDASAELPANQEHKQDVRALLVAIFIPRYLRHFRLFVVPVLIGSGLGVMMTSLYFVQPQRLISNLIFLWVAGMVLGAFLIYSSLDRSAIVSAIGNTTEGSVDFDWSLISRILTWGVVPLLSLLAAQNPNFSTWVSTFVNAFGKTLR